MEQQNETSDPQKSPVLLKAEGEAMLQLALTLKAMLESPAYQDAANPSWWKRHFG
jgi:hypothetical protein